MDTFGNYISRCWFETLFIFIPTWGRFPILTSILQLGYHQLDAF